jgi:hypothetical protein
VSAQIRAETLWPVFGFCAAMMEMLLWNGVFASETALVPILAVVVTISLIAATLVTGLAASGRKLSFGWIGTTLGLGEAVIFVLMTTYFLSHMSL